MTIGHEESAASDAMVGKGVDRGEPGPFQIEKAPPDTMSLRAIWWWGSERVCAIDVIPGHHPGGAHHVGAT